ncbi:MAG: RNA polymerase sigma factor [Acidimicrobiia bacterium]
MDDVEAVERARAGDLDAFEALVVRHQAVAIRVAYAIAGAEAEDVVQEAFVKAHGALARFRPGAPFRPWLLRIVANEARNHRRSERRRTGLALRLAEEPALAPSSEEIVLGRARRAAVVAGLSRLSERDRLVLAYRYFAGLSEVEMAAALSCRPGTVKSRLARALRRLEGALANEGEPALTGGPHE